MKQVKAKVKFDFFFFYFISFSTYNFFSHFVASYNIVTFYVVTDTYIQPNATQAYKKLCLSIQFSKIKYILIRV